MKSYHCEAMARQTDATAVDLQHRFSAFVTERYPFAAVKAIHAFAAALRDAGDGGDRLERARTLFDRQLRGVLKDAAPNVKAETTPGVDAAVRYDAAVDELLQACGAFLRRAAGGFRRHRSPPARATGSLCPERPRRRIALRRP